MHIDQLGIALDAAGDEKPPIAGMQFFAGPPLPAFW
jgi:hypothetical protein